MRYFVHLVGNLFSILMINLVFSPKQPFCTILHTTVDTIQILQLQAVEQVLVLEKVWEKLPVIP